MSTENPGPSSDYSFNPWMQSVPPIQTKKPAYYNSTDAANYQTLVDQMTTPPEVIRAIRPPVGNPPFPPRYGYEQHQPTIFDVMKIGPATLMRDTSTKQESGQPGTMTPSLGMSGG